MINDSEDGARAQRGGNDYENETVDMLALEHEENEANRGWLALEHEGTGENATRTEADDSIIYIPRAPERPTPHGPEKRDADDTVYSVAPCEMDDADFEGRDNEHGRKGKRQRE
jgi:hypothetical protein